MPPDLPKFNPTEFPEKVLASVGIEDPDDLLPPDGLGFLGALLMVNQQCREIFEAQVQMSTTEWFVIANEAFGLGE